MAKVAMMRTTHDGKSWLLNLDGEIICEIESGAFADETSAALDAEKMIAVELRAHAASHGFFTT